MASSQFKEVVEKRKMQEQRVLSDIKKNYLSDGLSQKAREKVDIASIINN